MNQHAKKVKESMVALAGNLHPAFNCILNHRHALTTHGLAPEFTKRICHAARATSNGRFNLFIL